MTAMAAVAMGVAFTSCSHNNDFYGGEEGGGKINGRTAQEQIELDKAVYNAAFEKAFGKVAPTVDWGFGPSTVAGTRAVQGITFPTFKDGQCPSMPTKYSNTVPADAIYAKTYAEEHPNDKFPEGAVIYINEAYPQFGGGNQVGNVDNLIIYVDGNITLNEYFSQNQKGTTLCVTQGSTLKLNNVRENLTVYLAPKAKLDLSECQAYVWHQETNSGGMENGAVFTKGTAALYMSTGSRVEGGAIYFKDDYTVLNEGGTIDVGELHVENGAILYNKNKVKATGVIALRNTKGEIDNFGTMEGASMTLDANARFYNVAGGTVTISGLTKLNNDSGNNAWMNGGQFNTGSFEITGGCQDPAAFNNCHMTVTGKFFMNHGNFVLDGGAAVECGSFEWKDDNYFHMGGKALLKVTGQLLANNDDTGYGFYGDGTEYAVIQAGSVTKGTDSPKFAAAYFGNIFVDTNNHFPQGELNAQGTYYTFGDNVKFSFTDNTDVSGFQTSGAKTAKKAENFSITIPKDNNGCTPGYKYGDGTPTYRVIAEDLSASQGSDFDFNDVVFDVEPNEGGTTAKIILRAAGGKYALKVKDVEVHAAFGEKANDETGLYPLINTNPWNPEKTAILYDAYRGDFSSDAAIRSTIKGIPITVFKPQYEENGELKWVELEAETGKPACKILVDQTFEVVTERTGIADKNTNFHKFVQGTWDTETKGFWWKKNN